MAQIWSEISALVAQFSCAINIYFVDFVELPLPNDRVEYIHLFNRSDESLTLSGCRIEVWDVAQGNLLIKHDFSVRGTFDPGEHLLVSLSSQDENTGFYEEDKCEWFKERHWWICIGGYADIYRQRRAAPILFFRFLDQDHVPRASMKIERRCE